MGKQPTNQNRDQVTRVGLDSRLPCSQISPFEETENIRDSGSARGRDSEDLPAKIDRYEISQLLGEGGYGRVYTSWAIQR